MTIDAHNHFWNYDPAAYEWIDESMEKIRRDFVPADLRSEIYSAGIDGVVTVQARQCLEETAWLLRLASENSFIRGVVGWVDLCSANVGEQLQQFSENKKLKSVRHVVQGERDVNFLFRSDFNHGIRLLKNFSLAYDLLILERQLPQAVRFVRMHPEQRFILNHIGKPLIRYAQMEPWRTHIGELAGMSNVYCKPSGLVTEADRDSWTAVHLFPYFETVLEEFGADRLVFGSDWPVCLVASSYKTWTHVVEGWTAKLSSSERVRIFGAAAAEAYKL